VTQGVPADSRISADRIVRSAKRFTTLISSQYSADRQFVRLGDAGRCQAEESLQPILTG
jgi:hypothetical protein